MTAIIILAAGESSRLGRAKQMLTFKDKSLIKHTINAAVESGIGPVFVVIGANEKEIAAHIKDERVSIVINENWKEGMSSSIKSSLTYMLNGLPAADSIILMVCDQPFVSAGLLKSLIDTQRSSKKPIAACFYNETVGVPALFDKTFFEELVALKGDAGAKKIVLNNISSVACVPFANGGVDIDTEEDYERLGKIKKPD